jgi:hypothetical protein
MIQASSSSSSSLRAELHPEIEPYNSGMLALDRRHRM